MASSKPVRPAQELTPFGHALAGALGGVFSNAVVYPLDTIKTRIQADDDVKGKKKSKTDVTTLLFQIYKEEGILGYYKGFGASMVNTFSMQYAYFFFYSVVRGAYVKRISKNLPAGAKPPAISTAMELLLGAIAGALGQIFTIPVSVIATRQQIAVKAASFAQVARDIIAEDGIVGLWAGLRASLVLTVNPAITYGVFERIKAIFAPGNQKLSPMGSFSLGATSKTLATVVTYPYIMAKVRLQAGKQDIVDDSEAIQAAEEGNSEKTFAKVVETGDKPPVTKKPKYDGAVDILVKVLQQEGFLGWYKGMAAQITKAVLSQALLFMLKDQFEKYALIIMLIWKRMSSSS